MKPWVLALSLLIGIFLIGQEAFAQRGYRFTGQPLGPGFNGRAMGPGFNGTPTGPGFGSAPVNPIGFEGVPRGPGFEPSSQIGFQGDPEEFPVSQPQDPVHFREFGSGF